MHRTVVTVLAVAMLAGVVAADPALGGGRGLFRVYDARVEEDGALVWANRWMVNRVIHVADSSVYRGPLFGMEMSYAPFPFIEVWGNLLGIDEIVSRPIGLRYDWNGYGLGGKLSIPWIPVLKLAAAANWNNERSGHKAPVFMDGLFYKGGYWRAIGALRLWDLYKTLPTLMVNYGKDFDTTTNRRFAGAGIEFSTDVLDVFVEANAEGGPGVDLFKHPDKARITPGVRVKFPYFHLNGGVEMHLNDATPDYEAILGFSIVSPFPKHKPKPTGQIAGKVEDALTGKPLAAKIRFVNRKAGTYKTDAKTGTFYIAKSPVGALLIEASSKGYTSEAAPISLADQGAAIYTFRLKSAPVGTIAGRVYDAVTKRPLVAEVSVVDAKLEPAMTSANTGFFRFDELPAGLYDIKAECEGYVNGEQITEVEEAKVAKLEFGLIKPEPEKPQGEVTPTPEPEKPQGAETPMPAKVETVFVKQIDTTGQTKLTKPAPNAEPGTIITLRGVLFDFDRSDIREDGRPALLEAAKILNQNPGVKVEVRGFTDSLGSDEYNIALSERRAQAVFDLLVGQGIDGNRMEVRGFGKSNPVATNDTDEGRQQNRRVDLVVVK
jgi:outer membrane protein OmpA-like peptidoglycan-associated protein